MEVDSVGVITEWYFPFWPVSGQRTQGERKKVRKVRKIGRHNKGEIETERQREKLQDFRERQGEA